LGSDRSEVTVGVFRADQAGNIQEEYMSNDLIPEEATGTFALTVSNVAWGNVADTDRFGVVFYNEAQHNKQDGFLEIQTGTTDTAIETPFADLQIAEGSSENSIEVVMQALGDAWVFPYEGSTVAINLNVLGSGVRPDRAEIEFREAGGQWQEVLITDDLEGSYIHEYDFQAGQEYEYRVRQLIGSRYTPWATTTILHEVGEPIISAGSENIINLTPEGSGLRRLLDGSEV